MIGKSFGMPLSATLNWRLLASWTMRKSRRSSIAGYFFTQVAPGRVERLAVDRHRVRQVPGHAARLGVAVRAGSRA